MVNSAMTAVEGKFVMIKDDADDVKSYENGDLVRL
jgi:hypothetical protein